MTDRIRITLAVVGILIWAGLFYACEVRAQLPFDPSLYDCPPPPVPKPISPGADVVILPTSLNPISISVRRGWAPSTGLECWHASATASSDVSGLTSSAVTLGAPLDCIPVPEPPLIPAIAIGAMTLALLRWLRYSAH